MPHQPKISALMSAYNSGEFIEETIDSILAQSFEDFELIIVNDGSIDDTEDRVLSYNDKRIRYVPLKENVGVGKALSIGLDLVKAPYIAKVDSDDVNHLERFQKQIDYLYKNPNVTLCKTFIEYFPHNSGVARSERYRYMKETKEKLLNNVVSSRDIKKNIVDWLCIPHNSYMAHAAAIKKIGYKDVRMAEDYWLFYKMNEFGYQFGTVDEVLIKFRVRDTSLTGLGNNTDYYVDTIFEMKSKEIDRFIDTDEPIYIWGVGGLARSVHRALSKFVKVEGYVNYSVPNSDALDGINIFLFSEILSKSKKKIILAAQPVREKAVKDMVDASLAYGKDFFIFA